MPTYLTTSRRIIEEPLWAGNMKALPITGKAFNNKIGWSDNRLVINIEVFWDLLIIFAFISQRIFESMGFIVADNRVAPPPLENTTPEGRASRSKLLRIWVEVGALLACYTSRNRK